MRGRVVRQIEPRAGQHARQLLHVLLRVGRPARAAAHAERVQFHQLARVVLVDLAGRALRVVEVLEHRRRERRGQHEIAEPAERVRRGRPVPRIRRASSGRWPCPEKTLKWFIQNHVICSRNCDGDSSARIRCALRRLVHRLVRGLVQRRPRLLLVVFVRQRVDALLLGAIGLTRASADCCVTGARR